jgi:O-acetylserine/cysteine efflux transporter
MQKRHIFLAVLVTLVWGLNFPITKIGLRSIDPFLLTGIRFALAAFPLVFFIKRPNVNFTYLAGYGFLFGVVMWGLINYGIKSGVHPGIAALIIQLSAFFTIGWGALLFKEKVLPQQMAGELLALTGLAGIIASRDGEHQIFGLMLIVMSAAAWSLGNVIIKKSSVKEIFSFTVWASLFPPIPLLLFSWWQNGAAPYQDLINDINMALVLSLTFQVYLATHFCYWGWNSLLKLYPISTVAPASLLVPVFAITSSFVLLGEPISALQLVSAATIILAFAVGLYRKPHGGGIFRKRVVMAPIGDA